MGDNAIENPAIVRIENDEMRLVIFDRAGEVVWDYPLDPFCEALGRARSTLSA